jgi:hypothetical protein
VKQNKKHNQKQKQNKNQIKKINNKKKKKVSAIFFIWFVFILFDILSSPYSSCSFLYLKISELGESSYAYCRFIIIYL